MSNFYKSPKNRIPALVDHNPNNSTKPILIFESDAKIKADIRNLIS